MAVRDLTQTQLKEMMRYDPATGTFTWVRGRKFGKQVGYKSKVSPPNRVPKVYWRENIYVNGKRHQAYLHCLAFLYMTGDYPPRGIDVDHINQNSLDNRWGNLRLATRSQNNYNKAAPPGHASGVVGVTWSSGKGKWCAQIELNGRTRPIGYYDDVEDAIIAKVTAELENGIYNHAHRKWYNQARAKLVA